MCYVSVGFFCFHLFLHDSSFCFCFGISTGAGSRAENRMETCYDLARVFHDLGLDEHRQGSRSGSGCLCDVSCAVGFVNVTRTAYPTPMTTVICRASAWQVSDFETKSIADAWAQASSCQRKATVCAGGSCSLGAMETATFCVYRGPWTRSYVFLAVDFQTRWMSGSGTEVVESPSRGIVAE